MWPHSIESPDAEPTRERIDDELPSPAHLIV